MKDVIASFLELPVISAQVIGNELPISGKDDKRLRFDVKCKLVVPATAAMGGKIYEMQRRSQATVEMMAHAIPHDTLEAGCVELKKRSIFDIAMLHSAQKSKGVDYIDLIDSYQIVVCDFTVFPDDPDFINFFGFMNKKKHFILSEAVCLVFVELTKLGATMGKPVSEMSGAEMWALFFKLGGSPLHADLLDRLAKSKEEINVAVELLSNISKDEHQRAVYCSRLKNRMSIQSDLKMATKVGIEQGIEQGIGLGIEKGERLKSLQVAKTMLEDRLPVETIAKYSGLPLEEVKGFSNGPANAIGEAIEALEKSLAATGAASFAEDAGETGLSTSGDGDAGDKANARLDGGGA
ncbi:MAG: Rpn family recombination-promoting nuclease/putative transposase [Clostridiales bacterium]|nr:Rpn family recombination-promoting nuclease/putative transposase [Clostridiales bacterium]